MWHTKMHFSAKCNSARIAIQWFHIKHYSDYQYTKFQPYTFRVQKMCVFARYATLVPRLMGDIIKSLEREEKDLRRELKKMTPKKGTSAKTDPDLSALQAERDELKRQVLLKRECSERLKVNKEIQEFRKESFS